MPHELEIGQVLVRIIETAICGSQLAEIDGVRGSDRFLPHLLGHEAVGEVISTGPLVSKVKRGDRVVLHWRKGAGRDAIPYTYRDIHGNSYNGGRITTFSGFSVVSENRVTKIQSHISDFHAAVIGCALFTAFGVANIETNSSPGDKILIIGAGGIGLALTYFFSLRSPSSLVVIDKSAAKKELAIKAGATRFLIEDFHVARGVKEIEKTTGRFDLVIEATGTKGAIEAAFRLTSSNGRLHLVGVPDRRKPARIDTMELHLGKTLSGSNGGGVSPESVLIPVIEHISGKAAKNDWLTRETFKLSEINLALQRMRSGTVARVTIRP